jgi:hypothetical protein
MNRLFIWVLIGIFLYIILINANNIQEGIKGRGKKKGKGKRGKKKRRRQQRRQRRQQSEQTQGQQQQQGQQPPSTFMKLISYFPSPIRWPIVYVSIQMQHYYSKL